ncbi:Ubiquitin-like protein 7 [Camelus ferus]|nr:Ubiquitin-like protein 7 [Camelus ferus]
MTQRPASQHPWLLLLWRAAASECHPRSRPNISALRNGRGHCVYSGVQDHVLPWAGGFLFEGLSDDEDDFHPSARSTPSSSTPSSRPASLGYSGAAGPRPITQSELATALALASTPESSSHTPTPGTQGHSSGTSPMSSSVQSGTPITNDLFSQALQHALQASGQPSLQEELGRGSVTGEAAPSKASGPCGLTPVTAWLGYLWQFW